MIKTLPINLTRVVLDTRKVWKVRFGRNLKGDNLQISACKLRKTSKCEGISIMGRKKDPIWDHVEKLNDKEFKCKKCGEKFAGGASRIKAHLLGIEGKGIRTCDGIPKDVQLATSSTFGDSNKAPYGTVNSCNPQHSVISNMPNDSLRVRVSWKMLTPMIPKKLISVVIRALQETFIQVVHQKENLQ
ncbi:hypothetical protein L6164_002296 [Bauhinia variegata]|uniref:Uncharacterized protein n=1 Tax=Bauhinia variegata TaxID=167791 RepID=A0ACB9PXX3_BAUVA|nr:hypothetical protein L6164_002296 [Bauhinia variegata]